MPESKAPVAGCDWQVLCGAGGVAALLLMVCSIVTMIAFVTTGGPPATAQEAFALLQTNRALGFLRLDALTLISMPAYYVLFAGMYVALWGANRVHTTIAAALAFIGVTLFLTTPSVLSMAYLSDQYSAATSEARKALLLGAGEAILASDMWHSTGPFIGGILLQSGALWISAVMLRGKVFSKATAYIGLMTYALDLAHMLAGILVPRAGFILMAVAGPLYLIWFPLVGRRLYQLRRVESRTPSAVDVPQ